MALNLSNLADGVYTLKIDAQDSLDQAAPSFVASFTVDTTAPVLSINQAPTALTGSGNASFIFSATDNLSGVGSYQCALDAATFSSCASPVDLTLLASGNHVFKIKAFDQAQNASAVTSTSWTFDASAPVLSLTQKPTAVMNSKTAVFAFSGSKGGVAISSFDCSLDGAAPSTCTSPISYANLAEGSHRFSLRGQDSLGIISTPLVVTWSVNTALPVESTDACLPIAMPSADAVLSAPKKVFAHYFYPVPLSIDNQPPASDYYTVNYLNPKGEGSKFIASGGLMRERPLPVAPSSAANWQVLNMAKEVRLAIARGLNGFTFDIMCTCDATTGGHLMNMLQAAQLVDSRFKIVLMPDMWGLAGATDTPLANGNGLTVGTNAILTIIKALYANPALFRLADGRLVLAPFATEHIAPSAWAALQAQFKQLGYNVAFIPTFGSLASSIVSPYLSLDIAGLGNFGNPGTPDQLQWGQLSAQFVRSANPKFIYMAGFDPSSYKPQTFIYAEAGNSLGYRNGWQSAIDNKADMIQVVTWNDMGETSAIEPATSASGDTGNGFYNLTGYYATWFQNGSPPAVTHDVLYYFYRKQPTTAAAPALAQPMTQMYPQTPQNQIEMLAFLTAPGTLSITIGGKTYSKSASAGMTSFLVPTLAGIPTFTLVRNSAKVIEFQGKTQIYGNEGLPSGILDLTYWSGSASASGTCAITAQ